MTSKVRVYGKAQNRTALGIIHAYQIMYPHCTLEDLKKAFPDALNPDSGTKIICMSEKDVKKHIADGDEWYAQGQGYFLENDEWLIMPDKSRVAVVRMWTKPSFDRLVEHAKQYGIEVAEFEKGQRGEKGGYRLEYLNGYIPPKPEKSKTWLWILIAAIIIILGLLAWLLFGKKGTEVQVVEVEKTVVVHDTLYLQQLEEIETNYNAAEFMAGKADLSDDAKYVLHDLGKLMQKHPELRLRLAGHTSAEGDATFNQKLSEARAQAAVDFMIEHEGIAAERLEAIGYGSSQLKNTENPMAAENRRTEFEVLQ